MKRCRLRSLIAVVLVIAGPSLGRAQSSEKAVEQSATYVSQVDNDLTLRRVGVLPVSDNVDGIYARPIETQIIEQVKASHRWDFAETNFAGPMPSVSDLEEKPAIAIKTFAKLNADAIFVAVASRGPLGLSVRLDLFLKKDGRMIAQEAFKDNPRTEIPQLREQVKILYSRLVGKLPYQGLILSRQGNRVTINLGKSDGLRRDQIVSAVQIISVQRHPKFGFLISTDKEILGQIKILKVDETLSFGAIVNERERGAIARFAKITSLARVEYGDPTLDPDASKDLKERADSGVAFGDKPNEWVPSAPPAFGQVGFRVGFGSYSYNLSGISSDCCEAKSTIYPSITLDGEIWINPKWIAHAELTQGVLSTSNPRSGSSPSELNHSYGRYSLDVGYNFLLKDDFFGPKIQIFGGLAQANLKVDDSNARGLTSTSFSGLLVGVKGEFPVDDLKLWYAGAKFDLFLFPKMSESPVTSGGSPNASMNHFSLYGLRKLSENLRAIGSLDFSLYSASYSGAGNRFDVNGNPETATSLSQRHTVLSGGVVYMF